MVAAHEQFARDAAEQGARLVCFQELFTTGYFCQVQECAYFAFAESVPGPTTERFQDLARQLSMVMVLPLYEQASDGVRYNTAVVIDADGTFLGKYRKAHIPNKLRFWEQFYFAPGDLGFPVFDTGAGRIGVSICYDKHFPEQWRTYGLAGAEVVVNPCALAGPVSQQVWRIEAPAAALANGYFVASVNRVGRESFGANDFYGDSYVCDPLGRVVGDGYGGPEPALVVRDLDFDVITEARERLAFSRDRRPDLYGALIRTDARES